MPELVRVLEIHLEFATGVDERRDLLRRVAELRDERLRDDVCALDAFARTARLEGIIPALESSHALAWALADPDSELDLICLSGRGDKDLAEALQALERR